MVLLIRLELLAAGTVEAHALQIGGLAYRGKALRRCPITTGHC